MNFRFFGNKKTLNTPIPGEMHYGERILMSYVYKPDEKGYVLESVMGGERRNIESDCVNISGYKMIISGGKIVEGSSTSTEDGSERSLTTGETSSINL